MRWGKDCSCHCPSSCCRFSLLGFKPVGPNSLIRWSQHLIWVHSLLVLPASYKGVYTPSFHYWIYITCVFISHRPKDTVLRRIHVYILFEYSSLISVAVIKCSQELLGREGALFQPPIPGSSPSLWRDQVRNAKQLVPSHPHSGVYKRIHFLVLSSISLPIHNFRPST